MKENKLTPTISNNELLTKLNSANIKDSITLYDLLKRTEITINTLIEKEILTYCFKQHKKMNKLKYANK